MRTDLQCVFADAVGIPHESGIVCCKPVFAFVKNKFCEDLYMSDLTGVTISRLMNFHVLHQVAAGFEFLRTLQRKIS